MGMLAKKTYREDGGHRQARSVEQGFLGQHHCNPLSLQRRFTSLLPRNVIVCSRSSVYRPAFVVATLCLQLTLLCCIEIVDSTAIFFGVNVYGRSFRLV